VRGCAQQGTELANWPFDDIARIADADEPQRRALDALRIRVKAAAERSPPTARSRCPPYLRRGSAPWSSEST